MPPPGPRTLLQQILHEDVEGLSSTCGVGHTLSSSVGTTSSGGLELVIYCVCKRTVIWVSSGDMLDDNYIFSVRDKISDAVKGFGQFIKHDDLHSLVTRAVAGVFSRYGTPRCAFGHQARVRVGSQHPTATDPFRTVKVTLFCDCKNELAFNVTISPNFSSSTETEQIAKVQSSVVSVLGKFGTTSNDTLAPVSGASASTTATQLNFELAKTLNLELAKAKKAAADAAQETSVAVREHAHLMTKFHAKEAELKAKEVELKKVSEQLAGFLESCTCKSMAEARAKLIPEGEDPASKRFSLLEIED